jgi:hypothetical protein
VPSGSRRTSHERVTGGSSRQAIDDGYDLLVGEFNPITRHHFTSELRLPDPGPVEDYVRSMINVRNGRDIAAVAAAVAGRVGPAPLRVRVDTGCLVCV